MSAYSSLILGTANVLGAWSLGEASGASSVTDLTGNGHTGTPTSVTFGAASLLQSDTGTSATFNGSTSGISIASSSSFLTTAGTAECWFKTSASGIYQDILRHDGDIGDVRGWLLRVDATGNKLRFFASFGTFVDIISSGAVNDGKPHLAAVTWSYNGSTTTYSLYLDGVSVGSGSTSGAPPTVTVALQIGRWVSGGSSTEVFSGQLEWAVMYGRALSLSEQVARVTAGKTMFRNFDAGSSSLLAL